MLRERDISKFSPEGPGLGYLGMALFLQFLVSKHHHLILITHFVFSNNCLFAYFSLSTHIGRDQATTFLHLAMGFVLAHVKHVELGNYLPLLHLECSCWPVKRSRLLCDM